MNPALWVAKTGLDAQQTRMSVVANNMANSNTTGFKKDRAVFEDLIYQNYRQAGASSSATTNIPSGINIGTGVKVVATQKMHTQGNIAHTGNSLDIAISGRGFFQVQTPDGDIAYTRDGSFQVNESGQVVTSSGYLLDPNITIPDGAVSITVGNDGTVEAVTSSASAPTNLGTIQLADFINPSGLQPMGENLFRETTGSGSPTTGTPGLSGLGRLNQGMLESSNVNIAEEMVNMIETQRAYETNAKAIAATDQMMQYANNNL
ncbi:MAG: flagellar basal-body rod protein FlgG [Gammaproteobacteria bacterium]|nr:MAG: flagellar basal-body rod protein FlgG [Gammaproteobacteria bacterium]